MAENAISGYVFLHRSLLTWEWYNDINTKCLFIHCLLKANWQDTQWRNINVVRGSFITSLENLSNETGLSVKKIRASLDKLKRAGNLAITTTNKYSVVSIVKYDDYQYQEPEKGTQKGTQMGAKRATDKEYNNINNIYTNNLSVNWDALVEQFNEITGKKTRVVNTKTKRQFKDRLKEGYTKEDFVNAITNCSKDPFQKDNGLKYLTLEFISRADKLEKYATMNPKLTG